jgi:hypothetical protein
MKMKNQVKIKIFLCLKGELCSQKLDYIHLIEKKN